MSERDEYAEMYSTLQLGETLVEANGVTLVPTMPTRRRSHHDSLPHISIGEATDRAVDLRMHETLGQGGMGLVRSAEQIPIGRNVAVKTLLPEHSRATEAASLLVQEAIVTGRLEHPNVVPIYSVGRDDDGLPVIVMKRVDGLSWREMLNDPGHNDGNDPLGRQLEIFKSVCTATHFANMRGVIHRDVKPENVMLGELGEVYLVDWGLALRLERDPTGALPSVDEVNQVAGTPAYMAPEMASGDFEKLGVHTDVYLLGAVLHELVTGTTRHRGADVFQLMFSAFRSEPYDYTEAVPDELATICNRATARDPSDRFESALELRDAIDEFLAHRDSRQLSAEAQEELAELERLVADADEMMDEEQRRVAVYRRFGAARFGFETALGSWSGNRPAAHGLNATIRTMIDWEVQHDSVHAARALLAELDEPASDLLERIETLEAKQGRQREDLAELRSLQRDLDTRVGQRSRGVMLALLLVFGFAAPAVALYSGWLTLRDPLTFWLIAPVTSVMTCLGMYAAWRGVGPVKVTQTETNRKMLISVFIACAFLTVFRGAAMLGGTSISTTLGLELTSFSALVAAMALAYDKRLLAMTPYYALGGFGPIAFPDYALSIYGVTHGLALAHMSVAWGRGEPAEASEDPLD